MADPFRTFTASTPNPSGRTNNPIDANVIPYVYVDMRGHRWWVVWQGQGWIAKPTDDAIAAYGLTDANNRNAEASHARGIIEVIDDKIETKRVVDRDNKRAGSWWMLLVIVGGLYYYDKKSRRR